MLNRFIPILLWGLFHNFASLHINNVTNVFPDTTNILVPFLYEKACPNFVACRNQTEISNVTSRDFKTSDFSESCCDDTCSSDKTCCPKADRILSFSSSCLPVSIRNGTTDDSGDSYMLIDRCPRNTQENNTFKGCENNHEKDLISQLPVSSKVTNNSYKNVYCAKCHSEETNLTYWDPLVVCKNNGELLMRTHIPDSWNATYQALNELVGSDCYFRFVPPQNVQHAAQPCFRNAIYTCSHSELADNARYHKHCRNTHLPITFTDPAGNSTIYANIFCLMCNGYEVDNISCLNIVKSGDPPQVWTDDYDFKARLNLWSGEANWPTRTWRTFDILMLHDNLVVPECGNMAILDPFTNSCRSVVCPEGSQLIDDNCGPLFDYIMKANYVIKLKISPWLDEIQDLDREIKISIINRVLEQLFLDLSGSTQPFTFKTLLVSESKQSEFVFLILKVQINNEELSVDVYNRLFFNTRVYNHDLHLNGTVTDTPVFLKIDIAAGIKIKHSVVLPDRFAVVDTLAHTVLKTLYVVNNFSRSWTIFQKMSLHRLSFCHQVVLEANEVKDRGDYIITMKRSQRFYEGDFLKTDGNYRVCLNEYLKPIELTKKRKNQVHSAQAILSLVCNVMSITGLVVTFMTYVLFSELRSIPGKNNMMLALHLLIAQCLYQFGIDQTESETVCIALGILIHMFWLTAILWMNACTLHMFRTFVTGQTYRSVRAFDPQVCMYAAYCYCVAIMLVSTNIGVSLYRSGGHSIGYGGRMCYISKPHMIGWLFALPVGIVIVVNMGFFLAVVYQISVSTMTRRSKSSDRTNAVIYMKLSSLTGVTWVFGYLYLWTEFDPFEYVFIILNAGQGVLIFISFICTSRIARLYIAILKK